MRALIYLFHIWTNRWAGMHHFVHQKLIQYGCFAGIVEAHHHQLVLCEQQEHVFSYVFELIRYLSARDA